MESPKEAKQQAGRPLTDSPLLRVIARKLSEIEIRPDLRSVTLVITLNRRGDPRTIMLRTESKSELSS